MEYIHDLITKMQLKNRRAVMAKSRYNEDKRKLDEAIENVRQAIKEGQSTLINAKDIAIFFHGTLSNEVARVYGGIDKLIADHKGQLAMLALKVYDEDDVKYNISSEKHVLPPRDFGLFNQYFVISVGVLSGENLKANYEKEDLFIPVREYVCVSTNAYVHGGSVRVIDGGINLRDHLGQITNDVGDLSKKLMVDPRPFMQPSGVPYIIIGDNEVEKWFVENKRDDLFSIICNELRSLTLQPTTEEDGG